jgi:hypothetical protein
MDAVPEGAVVKNILKPNTKKNKVSHILFYFDENSLNIFVKSI